MAPSLEHVEEIVQSVTPLETLEVRTRMHSGNTFVNLVKNATDNAQDTLKKLGKQMQHGVAQLVNPIKARAEDANKAHMLPKKLKVLHMVL